MSTSHEFFPANDDVPRSHRPSEEQTPAHLHPTSGNQQGRDATNQTPHSILQNQRRFGNRYVQRLLGVSRFRPQPALGIQRKLYVKEVVELAEGLPKDIANRIKEALKEVTTEPKIESQEIQSIITEWIKEPKPGRAYSTWAKAIEGAISEAQSRQEAKKKMQTSANVEAPKPSSMDSKQEEETGSPPPPPSGLGYKPPSDEEIALAKKPAYEECLKKGKERAERLKTEKPKGRADNQTQRDEFFKLYSITDADPKSYPGSQQAQLLGDLGGTYINKLQTGHIGAENNAHVTPGQSLLSNSEILYQMYKHQTSKEKTPALDKLSRINVASGNGSAVVIYIQYLEKKEKKNETGVTVKDGDDYFYALLGTDNGNAAEWLIRDHGEELNIGGISGAKLTFTGATFEFFFTPWSQK